jgi:hypothetical protein
VTQTFTLTEQQRDEFDRRGVLRLEGLISADRVARARELVQRQLAPLGLWRDGAWRLEAVPKPGAVNGGVKTSKAIGNKRPEIEALIEDPALRSVVDHFLGGRPFDRSMHPRPTVLFTLPNTEVWTLPIGWHTDTPRLASGEWPGVQVFICLDAVEPGGGGTLVVAGSHRLLNDGRSIVPRDFPRLLNDEPFFRDLFSGRGAHHHVANLPTGLAEGVALEVVELTGAPGDVYVTDLRLLHAAAPNAGVRPRIMATDRFLRADLVGEVAQAYGWR